MALECERRVARAAATIRRGALARPWARRFAGASVVHALAAENEPQILIVARAAEAKDGGGSRLGSRSRGGDRAGRAAASARRVLATLPLSYRPRPYGWAATVVGAFFRSCGPRRAWRKRRWQRRRERAAVRLSALFRGASARAAYGAEVADARARVRRRFQLARAEAAKRSVVAARRVAAEQRREEEQKRERERRRDERRRAIKETAASAVADELARAVVRAEIVAVTRECVRRELFEAAARAGAEAAAATAGGGERGAPPTSSPSRRFDSRALELSPAPGTARSADGADARATPPPALTLPGLRTSRRSARPSPTSSLNSTPRARAARVTRR